MPQAVRVAIAISAKITFMSYPHARSKITDPTEYPAPNEQINPTSPTLRSSEYFENAIIDPADDVLA
jgi:hypothetical protein